MYLIIKFCLILDKRQISDLTSNSGYANLKGRS